MQSFLSCSVRDSHCQRGWQPDGKFSCRSDEWAQNSAPRPSAILSFEPAIYPEGCVPMSPVEPAVPEDPRMCACVCVCVFITLFSNTASLLARGMPPFPVCVLVWRPFIVSFVRRLLRRFDGREHVAVRSRFPGPAQVGPGDPSAIAESVGPAGNSTPRPFAWIDRRTRREPL